MAKGELNQSVSSTPGKKNLKKTFKKHIMQAGMYCYYYINICDVNTHVCLVNVPARLVHMYTFNRICHKLRSYFTLYVC